MNVLRPYISQIVQEHEVIELPALAQKLNTSEAHLHVVLEQMTETDTNIRIEDDVVYWIGERRYLNYLIPAVLFGMIVIVPVLLQLN